MTEHQAAALRRLLIIAVAWAVVETLLRLLGMGGIATFAGAAAAVGAFLLTRDLRIPRRRKRGDIIYWRGRQIDRSDWN